MMVIERLASLSFALALLATMIAVVYAPAAGIALLFGLGALALYLAGRILGGHS